MANIFKSKFTGEQIEEILDKANNVTDITPNPVAEATEVLQTITIGSTTFSIPQGVSVEGNPSGDATVELTKLKVGDTIYSIPQNSGGGGGGTQLYRHTITFDNGSVLIALSLSDNNSTDDYSVGSIITDGAIYGMAKRESTRYLSVVCSIQGYGLTRAVAAFSIYTCIYDPNSSAFKGTLVATNSNYCTSHSVEAL